MRLDADGMIATFSDEAMVRDERQTHVGRAAIRAWIEQSSLSVQAIAEPRSIAVDGATLIVETKVSGAFPGSPVTLRFRFLLDADGQIADLEIG